MTIMAEKDTYNTQNNRSKWKKYVIGWDPYIFQSCLINTRGAFVEIFIFFDVTVILTNHLQVFIMFYKGTFKTKWLYLFGRFENSLKICYQV